MSFETIFLGIIIPATLGVYIYALIRFKDDIQPFPKGIKKRIALKWYLQTLWFNGILNKKRFCVECGWPLTYIDDLYDIPVEAISPDVIAECPNPKCLTQYRKHKSCITGKSYILPIEKSVGK